MSNKFFHKQYRQWADSLPRKPGPGELEQGSILDWLIFRFLKEWNPHLTWKTAHKRFPGFFLKGNAHIEADYSWLEAEPVSLSELNEEQAVTPVVLGDLLEMAVLGKKGKGIVYSRRDLAKAMGRMILWEYLAQGIDAQSADILFNGKPGSLPEAAARQIDRLLAGVTVCDPAVGAGVFLVCMLEEILRLRLRLQPRPAAPLIRHALTHSLYGVDIYPEAVRIAQIRLLLIYLAAGGKGALPLPHIQAGDSLQLDWESSCPAFSQKQGFDIILGNPPYVGEKGHKELFAAVRQGPLGRFYQARMDLFYFFFHLALNIGRPGALIAYVTTNYYLTASGASKLRRDICQRAAVRRLVDFGELKLFPDALGQHNLVTLLEKGARPEVPAGIIRTRCQGLAAPEEIENILRGRDRQSPSRSLPQSDLFEGPDCQIRLGGAVARCQDSLARLLYRLAEQGQPLGTLCHVNQGIVSGADRVLPAHRQKYGISLASGSGIFVLDQPELARLDLSPQERQALKPWFKNSDIGRWLSRGETSETVLYLDRSWQELPPALAQHLEPYAPILRQRREVRQNCFPWWQLHWPRRQAIFEGPKLVVPQRSLRNTFAYHQGPWYASADVYFITSRDAALSLKYVLALLNSDLYLLWLATQGKRKGRLLELYQQPLSQVPVRVIPPAEQKPFIALVDGIMAAATQGRLNRARQLEIELESRVCQLYGLTPRQQQRVQKEVRPLLPAPGIGL